eukprot:gene49689-34188_t
MGGRAIFRRAGPWLQTFKLVYGCKTFGNFVSDKRRRFSYTEGGTIIDPTETDFGESRLTGWRFAEKAIIASLLSETNLVMHVTHLHLEIAATFEAVTVDAFACGTAAVKHPVRRLLDPFTHRSIQATNDNFKLLLRTMDMNVFAIDRGTAAYSTDLASTLGDVDFKEGPFTPEGYGPAHWQDINNLTLINVLSTLMTWLSHVHEDVGHAAAAYVFRDKSEKFETGCKVFGTQDGPRRFPLLLLFNPVHTPMCVPEDGVGIPYASFLFNVAAYRGFVFLDRADLTADNAEWPNYWFNGDTAAWSQATAAGERSSNKQCFFSMQSRFRELEAYDDAFAECDGSNHIPAKRGKCQTDAPHNPNDADDPTMKNPACMCAHPQHKDYDWAKCKRGFYSCVDRMETAVSS